MNSTLTSLKWILFVLSFLSYAIAHLSGLPNRELTDREFELSPKNSEDDVSFRSLSYGHTSPSDEDEEFDNENDLNDVDFDEEVDREVGLPSITNNKRSPNSAQERSFKNKAGYYLIEGPGHTVTGTTSLTRCNANGVFLVGKTAGKNFIKSKTGWYLAINASGNVYMTNNAGDPNTNIHTGVISPNGPIVSLYRYLRNPIQRLFLDITPQNSGVQANNFSDTSSFRLRLGSKC